MDDIIPQDSWDYTHYIVLWPLYGADAEIRSTNSIELAIQYARKFLREQVENLTQMGDEDAQEWYLDDLKGRKIYVIERRRQRMGEWSLRASRTLVAYTLDSTLEVVEVTDAES